MIHIVPKPTDSPSDNSTTMVAREITKRGRSYSILDPAGIDPFSAGISGSLIWVCGLAQDDVQFEVLNALSVENRVVNSPLSIFTCASKVLTSALLVRRGIPTPETCFTQSRTIAAGFISRHQRVVSKPVYGYDGHGIALVQSPGDLGPPPYYLQEYVPNDRDFRVFVIDGEALGAIERISDTLAHNIHQGGIGRPVEIDPLMADRAVASAHAVGVDYGGVDLLPRGDDYCVLEVNGTPNWHCMGVNIPAFLAEYLIDQEGTIRK